MEPRIGQVVRFGEGSTAVMKITSLSFGGRVYGDHILGGATGADLDDLQEATAHDLVKWEQRSKPST